MEKFNRANLADFRKEFAESVKELEDRFKVKVELGSIKFSEFQFKATMSVNKVNPDDVAQRPVISDRIHNLANSRIKSYNVDFNGENFIGTIWNYGKKKYMVVNINTRKPKNCWELRDLNSSSNHTVLAPSGFFARYDVTQSHAIEII